MRPPLSISPRMNAILVSRAEPGKLIAKSLRPAGGESQVRPRILLGAHLSAARRTVEAIAGLELAAGSPGIAMAYCVVLRIDAVQEGTVHGRLLSWISNSVLNHGFETRSQGREAPGRGNPGEIWQ